MEYNEPDVFILQLKVNLHKVFVSLVYLDLAQLVDHRLAPKVTPAHLLDQLYGWQVLLKLSSWEHDCSHVQLPEQLDPHGSHTSDAVYLLVPLPAQKASELLLDHSGRP